jgi:ribosomal RNA assembly protein
MDAKTLKVPIERVAVLIGVEGKVKREIETKMKVSLHIDSKEGEIVIEGEDSLAVYEAQDVIKAIGRGFNPKIARLLFNEQYALEMIGLQDYIGRSKQHSKRIKGRVIGSEGKSRKAIEYNTDTHICVYGKTIGIIGKHSNIAVARQAVEMLLEGSPHGNVFKWLENKRRELIREELESNPGF